MAAISNIYFGSAPSFESICMVSSFEHCCRFYVLIIVYWMLVSNSWSWIYMGMYCYFFFLNSLILISCFFWIQVKMCTNSWPLLVDFSRDESKRFLRQLELEAYASIVSAFRAQGDLNKDKKRVLQDLQNALRYIYNYQLTIISGCYTLLSTKLAKD